MTDHLDEILLEYVQALTLASRALFTQDTAPPPQVTQPALLTLPGDYLCVKVHKRNSLKPRWTDPDKVLLATPFSVSPLGKYGAEWHHLTHTRKAENHTSRTYDQVHADLLDLEHDAPTAQPAVQQEPPRRPVSVCGNPVECVGRPADPVRAPATLPENLLPRPRYPRPWHPPTTRHGSGRPAAAMVSAAPTLTKTHPPKPPKVLSITPLPADADPSPPPMIPTPHKETTLTLASASSMASRSPTSTVPNVCTLSHCTPYSPTICG